MTGVGLTVTVNVFGCPEHKIPFTTILGVTTIVASMGNEPEFVAVNELMFPVPLIPIPTLVLLLVQT